MSSMRMDVSYSVYLDHDGLLLEIHPHDIADYFNTPFLEREITNRTGKVRGGLFNEIFQFLMIGGIYDEVAKALHHRDDFTVANIFKSDVTGLVGDNLFIHFYMGFFGGCAGFDVAGA
ncbi:hypothetical protein [Terasakiella sp.]|uniref:hypothetical protein n=1 Tax=Terasakiella sp. TaxID=2034861 RepID=UPI003AA94250